MASTGLLELPAELALLFMTQLETPRDLFACIRVSRHFWDIFQVNRTVILAAVIENAAPEGNLGIAIAACKAARVSELWWSNAPATAVRESETDFEETYPKGRASDYHPLRDCDLLVALHRLWWVSDYFMSAFELEARKLADLNAPRKERKPATPMKRPERLRLQRAFFRFEIYRRITPACFSEQSLLSNQEIDRVAAIMKWYPPWEREELLSVQEFLVSFVKRIHRNLQCYIVAEISRINKARGSLLGETRPFEECDSQSLQVALEHNGLDLWNQGLSVRHYQYLVARGLPFIRWLSELPPRRATSTMTRFLYKNHEPSILEELVSKHAHLIAHDAAMAWPDDGPNGALESPNQGWKWALSHDLVTQEDHTEPPYEPLLRRYTLRSMGYVFWDATRVSDEWGFASTRPAMLKLRPRRDHDDHDHHSDMLGLSIKDDFEGSMFPASAGHQGSGMLAWLEEDGGWANNFFVELPTAFSRRERELYNIEY